MTRWMCLLVGLALAGCGPRGQLTIYPAAADVAAVESILVGAARSPDGSANAFAFGRPQAETFAAFDVAVPPDRAPGTVSFPARLPPDPATDFVTVSATKLGGEDGLVAAINRKMAALPPEDREVFVFTHGFNTNFSEGLYRHAQMRHDFGTPGASVHFSWPSAASVTAYAFDRESAIFARDGMQRTLEAVARSDARRIVVAAHSMGAMVLMEALRSMAIDGAPGFFDKLQAIVLMAPDLDVDVFRGQVAPLDRFDVPVYIFFSSLDRALRASAILRGDSERLGSIRDFSRVDGLPVTLIDTSTVDDGQDALGHFAVATSPTMIAFIQGMTRVGDEIIEDARISPNAAESAIGVIQGVGDAVLAPLTQP